MLKEQLISKEAMRLRIKYLTNGLTELECQDFIQTVVSKALSIDDVVAHSELLKAEKEAYKKGFNDGAMYTVNDIMNSM